MSEDLLEYFENADQRELNEKTRACLEAIKRSDWAAIRYCGKEGSYDSTYFVLQEDLDLLGKGRLKMLFALSVCCISYFPSSTAETTPPRPNDYQVSEHYLSVADARMISVISKHHAIRT